MGAEFKRSRLQADRGNHWKSQFVRDGLCPFSGVNAEVWEITLHRRQFAKYILSIHVDQMKTRRKEDFTCETLKPLNYLNLSHLYQMHKNECFT